MVLVIRLSAQTTSTGSWYGRADVDLAGIHNNYLTELVIKQKGTRVEGIFGYYFKDKYESFFIHGSYNPKTKEVIILNIPLIYFNANSTVNSVECNTNFRGYLINSKVGSSLKGFFYRDDKYKYTCPDIRVNYTLDKGDQSQDTLMNIARVNAQIWKPQADDYVVDVMKTDQSPLVVEGKDSTSKGIVSAGIVSALNTTPENNQQVNKDRGSVAQGGSMTPVAATAPAPAASKEDNKKISESFNERKTVLNRILDVESDSVRVSFYDNGVIDGDSISVFVNNHVVLVHQELAAKAFNLYLKLDSTRELNEISMFAENLGKYPPNTALMIVTDGKNRYEVFMSSSLTENATVKLRKRKKEVSKTGPGRRLSFSNE